MEQGGAIARIFTFAHRESTLRLGNQNERKKREVTPPKMSHRQTVSQKAKGGVTKKKRIVRTRGEGSKKTYPGGFRRILLLQCKKKSGGPSKVEEAPGG